MLRPSRLHAGDENDNVDSLRHRLTSDSDAGALGTATAVYAIWSAHRYGYSS